MRPLGNRGVWLVYLRSLSMVALVCEACVGSLRVASWGWHLDGSDQCAHSINSCGVALVGIVSSPNLVRHVYWKWSVLGLIWVLDRSADGHTKHCCLMCVEFNQKHFNSSQLLMINDYYKKPNLHVSPIGVKKPLYVMCSMFTKYSHDLCTIWSIPSSKFDNFAFCPLQLKPEDIVVFHWCRLTPLTSIGCCKHIRK